MYHIIKHHVPRLGTMQSRGLSPEATHGKTRSNSRRMLATTLGASVLRVSRCLNVAASASSILCLSTPAGHLEAQTRPGSVFQVIIVQKNVCERLLLCLHHFATAVLLPRVQDVSSGRSQIIAILTYTPLAISLHAFQTSLARLCVSLVSDAYLLRARHQTATFLNHVWYFTRYLLSCYRSCPILAEIFRFLLAAGE